MTGEEFFYEMTITEEYTDFLGHLNNAYSLKVLENARLARMENHGFKLDEMMKKGLAPVSIEINIKFKKEIKLGSKVKVKSFCHPYQGLVFTIEQSIINEAGVTCCEAKIVSGLFDMKLRRLTNPTPEWLAALGLPNA